MSNSQPILTVVGARPQFVKLGPVSRALRGKGLGEFLVHTGQHHDPTMYRAFLDEFELPEPDVDLGIAAPGPINQLADMVPALARTIEEQQPQVVVVFGDTTSTIAAALAAAYVGVPVAHVEAGMRSFVPKMPEEIARTVTDRLSTLWFAASPRAVENLEREGLGPVDLVGDTMFDLLCQVMPRLDEAGAQGLEHQGVDSGKYVLLTLHRAANTDDAHRLAAIMTAMSGLEVPVLFPIHPRTRLALARHGLEELLAAPNLQVLEPLGYFETMMLVRHARRVFTDSGGLQKEALYLGTPCTTLREETEWTETVESGWNLLAGADGRAIRASLTAAPPAGDPPRLYGNGRAAEAIATRLAARCDGAGA